MADIKTKKISNLSPKTTLSPSARLPIIDVNDGGVVDNYAMPVSLLTQLAKGDKGDTGPEGPASTIPGPAGPPGPAGSGTGDMLVSVYDPSSKAKEVAFKDEADAADALKADKSTTYIKSEVDSIVADATLSSETSLYSHTSNTSNPHSVTKVQVGLGNVDNTSDANKPISTATQTALDGKASVASVNAKENSANKSTSTSLGTSNTLFPTQNAVKAYVDSRTSISVLDSPTLASGWAYSSTYAPIVFIKDNYSGVVTVSGTVVTTSTQTTNSVIVAVPDIPAAFRPPGRVFCNTLYDGYTGEAIRVDIRDDGGITMYFRTGSFGAGRVLTFSQSYKAA